MNLHYLKLNKFHTNLQEKNILIPHMVSRIFAFKKRLIIFIEKVSVDDFSNFSKINLITRVNIINSNDTNVETLKP